MGDAILEKVAKLDDIDMKIIDVSSRFCWYHDTIIFPSHVV